MQSEMDSFFLIYQCLKKKKKIIDYVQRFMFEIVKDKERNISYF